MGTLLMRNLARACPRSYLEFAQSRETFLPLWCLLKISAQKHGFSGCPQWFCAGTRVRRRIPCALLVRGMGCCCNIFGKVRAHLRCCLNYSKKSGTLIPPGDNADRIFGVFCVFTRRRTLFCRARGCCGCYLPCPTPMTTLRLPHFSE